MPVSTLHPATAAELDALWPAARAAHIFPDKAALQRHHAQAPWRVRVSSAGAAAVLERWRDDSDILAIRGLWCAESAIPGFVAQLADVARAQGFARLMSPLVPADACRAYVISGMAVAERLVSLRVDRPVAATLEAQLPAGIRLRRSCAADVDALDAIDRACFEPFWAYGAERIAAYITQERVHVAESDGRPIGYTLCTVERSSGTLGRLAVLPEHRRAGLGTYLVVDAVRAMLEADAAAVTLCTQEDNVGARSLYRSQGFREMPGGLVLLISQA